MPQLQDKETGKPIGAITEAQLQFLIDQLEEESATDDDYYIDAPTIELLESEGADAPLLGLLRTALGQQEGVEIRWSR